MLRYESIVSERVHLRLKWAWQARVWNATKHGSFRLGEFGSVQIDGTCGKAAIGGYWVETQQYLGVIHVPRLVK